MWCKFIFNDFEELVDTYTIEKSSENYRDDFIIARLNGQEHHEIMKEYRVIYFPSLYIFYPNDKKIKSEFNGNKTKTEFMRWINKNLPEYKPKKEEEVVVEEVIEEPPDPRFIDDEEEIEEVQSEEPKVVEIEIT